MARHLLAFAALLVNLWLVGDLVAAVAGGAGRVAFEFTLIVAYATIVLGVRVPPVWRRPGRDTPRSPRER